MSAHQLFIVDTQISQSDAVTQAHNTYQILCDTQVIEPVFPTIPIPNAYEPCFKITDKYQKLDELTGCTGNKRSVHGLSINVFGHCWVAVDGLMRLLPVDQVATAAVEDQLMNQWANQTTNALFHNMDGGFSSYCPNCEAETHIGDADADAEDFELAIGAFIDEGEMPDLCCHHCQMTQSLNRYFSDDFAVGYFAITLYGVEVLDASQNQMDDLLKDFGFERASKEIAWVSCCN